MGESSLSLKVWDTQSSQSPDLASFLVREDSLFVATAGESQEVPTEDVLLAFSPEDIPVLTELIGNGKIDPHQSFNHWLLVGIGEKDLSLLFERDNSFSSFLKQLPSFFYTSLSGMRFFASWYRLWVNIRSTSVIIHGTLMNIFGVGVLLVGDSGIGKSEAAYGLVRRGHRLICDDAVRVMHAQFFKDKLLGFPAEPTLQGFMEVKGVGIVNVIAMHGVSILQDYSRIDMVVELQEEQPCESFGIHEVLGQTIPKIFLEIKGHQDWISLLESVILNNKLKLLFDYDALDECEVAQKEVIRRKTEGL